MKPQRIGFDVDGVLADFHPYLCKLAIKKYGNASTESRLKMEASILDSEKDEFWSRIHPIDVQATMVGMSLESFGDYRFFITRRPPCTHAATQNWLSQHFGFGGNDVLISGAIEKGQVVAGLYLDGYFDDDPIHLIQVHKLSPKTAPYLVDHPYNQWFDEERWNKEHSAPDRFDIMRVK